MIAGFGDTIDSVSKLDGVQVERQDGFLRECCFQSQCIDHFFDFSIQCRSVSSEEILGDLLGDRRPTDGIVDFLVEFVQCARQSFLIESIMGKEGGIFSSDHRLRQPTQFRVGVQFLRLGPSNRVVSEWIGW